MSDLGTRVSAVSGCSACRVPGVRIRRRRILRAVRIDLASARVRSSRCWAHREREVHVAAPGRRTGSAHAGRCWSATARLPASSREPLWSSRAAVAALAVSWRTTSRSGCRTPRCARANAESRGGSRWSGSPPSPDTALVRRPGVLAARRTARRLGRVDRLRCRTSSTICSDHRAPRSCWSPMTWTRRCSSPIGFCCWRLDRTPPPEPASSTSLRSPAPGRAIVPTRGWRSCGGPARPARCAPRDGPLGVTVLS